MGVPIRAELILSTKESGGSGAGKVLASDKTSGVMEKYVKPVMSLLLTRLLGGTLFKGLLTGLGGILGGLFRKGGIGAATTTGGIAGGAISGSSIGKKMWDGFKNFAKRGGLWLASLGGIIFGGLKTAARAARPFLKGLGKVIGGGLKGVLSNPATWIVGVLTTFSEKFKKEMRLVWGGFTTGGFVQAIIDTFKEAGSRIKANATSGAGFFGSLKEGLKTVFSSMGLPEDWLGTKGKEFGFGGMESTMHPPVSKGQETIDSDKIKEGADAMGEYGKMIDIKDVIIKNGLPVIKQNNLLINMEWMRLTELFPIKQESVALDIAMTESKKNLNVELEKEVRLLAQTRSERETKIGRHSNAYRYGTTHVGRKEYGEADEQGRRSVSGYSGTSVRDPSYQKYLKNKYNSKVPDAVG